MDPGPSFTTEIQSTAFFYFLHFLQVTFIIHTIRLILCDQQAGEIDNLTVTLGQSFLVVLCRCCLKPYSFDNIGFFSEGKLAATLIIPSSWGLPTYVWSARIKHIFWRRCRGFGGTPDLRDHRIQQTSTPSTAYFLAPLPPSSRRHTHQAAARGVSHFQHFYFVYCLA